MRLLSFLLMWLSTSVWAGVWTQVSTGDKTSFEYRENRENETADLRMSLYRGTDQPDQIESSANPRPYQRLYRRWIKSGLRSALRAFRWPSWIEIDILSSQMRGLSRGQGFSEPVESGLDLLRFLRQVQQRLPEIPISVLLDLLEPFLPNPSTPLWFLNFTLTDSSVGTGVWDQIPVYLNRAEPDGQPYFALSVHQNNWVRITVYFFENNAFPRQSDLGRISELRESTDRFGLRSLFQTDDLSSERSTGMLHLHGRYFNPLVIWSHLDLFAEDRVEFLLCFYLIQSTFPSHLDSFRTIFYSAIAPLRFEPGGQTDLVETETEPNENFGLNESRTLGELYPAHSLDSVLGTSRAGFRRLSNL